MPGTVTTETLLKVLKEVEELAIVIAFGHLTLLGLRYENRRDYSNKGGNDTWFAVVFAFPNHNQMGSGKGADYYISYYLLSRIYQNH